METLYKDRRDGAKGKGKGKGVNRSPKEIEARRVWCRAVNLRRDPIDPAVWRRAGTPRKVATGDALPFARFSPFGDGREICLLCGADNSLYYSIIGNVAQASSLCHSGEEFQGQAGSLCYNSGGEPVLLGKLPGRPLMAVTGTQGAVRLLVEHQPDQYLTYDGDLKVTLHGAMPELPGVCIVATEYNTLYGAVGAVKLTGTSGGGSGSQLSEADNRLLAAALTGAYDALCLRARGMGYCVQPRLARYRLLDAAGNTVGVGPTVAVSIPEGFSATGSIVQISDDGLQTLSEGRIEMGVYRLGVIAPPSLPAPWNRLVSKLVVEVTEELDPLSRGVAVGHGVKRDTPSGRVTVTSRLPGFSNGTVLDKPRLRRLGVEGMGLPLYVAGEIDTPFDGGVGTAGSIRAISVNGTLPAAPEIGEADLLEAGARSWSAGVRTSDVTVLCNPLTRPFGGWSPDCFIASRSAEKGKTWKLAVSVRLSTPAGEVWVRRESTSNGNAPTALSPLLSFPSADATLMTISYLSPDGKSYQEVVKLTPVAGRDLACHATDGLERLTFKTISTAYLPQGEKLPPRLEAGVAETYMSADLGRRIDRHQVADGMIHAVKVVPRSGSGWDFSRLKLLFFGEAGTQAATLNGSGAFHSTAPADHRPVMSAQAVCEATGNSGAMLLAYAGNDLIGISGQKVATLKASILDTPVSSASVGWEGMHREVWLSPADGSGKLWRLTEAGELIGASLTGLSGEGTLRFATEQGALLASSGNGVHNLSDETAAYSMDATLTTRVRVAASPSLLRLNIFATQVDGTVTLGGDRGTEVAERLLHLEIDGQLNAPVTLRLASPCREWLETCVSMTATPDLTILPSTFHTDDDL